jgi:hypothetical protein
MKSKKGKPVKLSGNTSKKRVRLENKALEDCNKTKYGKIKSILHKLFTVQTISLIIAIITAIIACVQCRDARTELEVMKREKQNDDKIKYHDDLVFRLGGFELKNQETYDIDIIRKRNDYGYIFKLQLLNGGKISAKNIMIRFGGKKKSIIMKSMRSKDEIDYEVSGGQFMVEYLYPKEMSEFPIYFIAKSSEQGEADNCNFACFCEDKANPFIVNINMRVYNFDSIEEYSSYIYSKMGSPQKAEEYWLQDNKFVINCTAVQNEKSTELDNTVYKVVKHADKLQLQSLSDREM